MHLILYAFFGQFSPDMLPIHSRHAANSVPTCCQFIPDMQPIHSRHVANSFPTCSQFIPDMQPIQFIGVHTRYVCCHGIFLTPDEDTVVLKRRVGKI
jgi:hypothetical protein